MKKRKSKAYTELAWTEHIIAPPEDYEEETLLFIQAIKKASKKDLNSLLHLGCGAGGNDHTFKRHFKVTGIDISKEMLGIAEKLNPEADYSHGDMRSIRLKDKFDVVAIPDSIGHITTKQDLRKTIRTADFHLNPGGVLLITALVHEDFQDNNFVYTNSKGDVEITLFENNHLSDKAETTYEATFVFLIRKQGKLEIHSDTETLGLFKEDTWHRLFKEAGFEIKQNKLKDLYDPYIAGEGEYPLTMFICTKS